MDTPLPENTGSHRSHPDADDPRVYPTPRANGKRILNFAGPTIEARLVASIATLDALFHRYIAKPEEAPSPRMQEMYAKMGFEAKGQAIRATDALSGIKTGPMVIARQVNLANGPQQVNNSPSLALRNAKNEGGSQNE